MVGWILTQLAHSHVSNLWSGSLLVLVTNMLIIVLLTSPASPALGLQAASTCISGLHDHVAAQKILTRLKLGLTMV